MAHSSAHLAYNAIIYFELSNARRTNYKFSFEAMLNMKGNTAMYLVYAYARIRYVGERRDGGGREVGGWRQEGREEGRWEAGGRREGRRPC
jgi:arginyl-tRNA synthetase